MLLDTGLFILRLVLGVVFVGHGAQKLFGWFGGGGLKGTAGWIGSMGMRPAWFWAFMASISEFGSGGLFMLGFLNPLGSLGVIAAMLMAIAKVHWTKGFWSAKGGYEFPLMNLAAALTIGFIGPGAFSVDGIFGFALPEPIALLVGLFVVVLSVVIAVLSEAPKTVPAAQAQQRGKVV